MSVRRVRTVGSLAAGVVAAALAVAVGAAVPAGAANASTAVNAVNANCVTWSALRPDAGFDPNTAPAAQLHAHDFPARPAAGTRARGDWQRYVAMYLAGQAKVASPCATGAAALTSASPQLQTGIDNGVHGTNGASYWSGNIAKGATYTDVESSWYVPVSSGSGLSSHWVGVGLGNSKTYPLVQAGDESPANAAAYGWVETWYPGDPQGEVKVPGFTSIGGDYLSVHVTFATSGAISIHMTDLRTGANYYPCQHNLCQHYTGMKPDGHAEWISEDPNAEAQPLADFVNCAFYSAEAYSTSTGWKYVGNLSHYYSIMTDSSNREMAYPGSIFANGQDFANYWVRAT